MMCDPQHEGSCGPSATCYAGACFDDIYTVTGCSDESRCGVFTRVLASCASGHYCPGGDYANGNTDPTLCDSAPVYQEGGPGGPVLYRRYYASDGGSTYWAVGPSDRLNDCYGGPYYLSSALNPGRSGGAPAAPEYSAGDGWWDRDNNADGTITVITCGEFCGPHGTLESCGSDGVTCTCADGWGGDACNVRQLSVLRCVLVSVDFFFC
eukprot:COSAG06_NODE_10022_length_1766_cov_132.211758_2_plen_209_part_00